MILASFDSARNRGAAVSGAYQYDTGQRIRMHGLPTPQELAEMDDFLSGDVVTVQAQFGFAGDAQSEPRLAQYDEEAGAWVADVPDNCMTRAETVNVYVYVMYGEDETHSRSKTMYTATFTPISRPAPSDAVTPEQTNAWNAMVTEINLTLAKMNTAVSETNAAAVGARDAAQDAQSAVSKADAVTAAWSGASATAQTLTPGSAATVSVETDENGTKQFTFGIPRGEKGDTGPAGVTFRLSDGTLYIDTV